MERFHFLHELIFFPSHLPAQSSPSHIKSMNIFPSFIVSSRKILHKLSFLK